jgi:hypothetical protein
MLSKQTRPRAWAVLALALSLACSNDEKAVPQKDTAPAAQPEPAQAEARVSARATLGGQIVAVGDFQTELAIHAHGYVRGLVFDASAKPVPPERVSDFSLTLSAEGAASPDLKLAWDAKTKCFAGQTGADIELVPGDVDVRLEVDGKVQSGVLAVATLLPALTASADVAGEAHAPTLAADAKAQVAAPAAAARASLAAKTKAAARAKAGAQAKATVAVPAPKVKVSGTTSAGTKGKPGASVKAKASFGLGK